jgi:hypothetical protein
MSESDRTAARRRAPRAALALFFGWLGRAARERSRDGLAVEATLSAVQLAPGSGRGAFPRRVSDDYVPKRYAYGDPRGLRFN